jgi:hypothetical protein
LVSERGALCVDQYSSGNSRVVTDLSASVMIQSFSPTTGGVAAQQSKAVRQAVLVLRNVLSIEFTPIPCCMTRQELGYRLVRAF